jgi:hypothetical protein
MSEQEKKPSASQRRQAERNKDAAQRQRDLLFKLLEAKKTLLAVKMQHYTPGPDFKKQLSYQGEDSFWEASRTIDEVNDNLSIIEVEGQIAQLEDRIKVYDETLTNRG